MFARHCRAHRDRAQEVAHSTEAEDDEEAKADAKQSVEERLDADAIDDVDEQAKAEQKSQRLKPNERSSRFTGSGFGFFDEFFRVTGSPVVGKLFSRFNQGDALTPLAVAFGFSCQSGSNSFTTGPGKVLKPLSQSSGTGLLSSRKFPLIASRVGTKLRLS